MENITWVLIGGVRGWFVNLLMARQLPPNNLSMGIIKWEHVTTWWHLSPDPKWWSQTSKFFFPCCQCCVCWFWCIAWGAQVLRWKHRIPINLEGSLVVLNLFFKDLWNLQGGGWGSTDYLSSLYISLQASRWNFCRIFEGMLHKQDQGTFLTSPVQPG